MKCPLVILVNLFTNGNVYHGSWVPLGKRNVGEMFVGSAYFLMSYIHYNVGRILIDRKSVV